MAASAVHAVGPAAEAAGSGAALREADPVLSLILPAYNEEERLPATLARCAEFLRGRALEAEIIVADDGSTDGTAAAFQEAVESLPAAYLHYRHLCLPHRGKGAAVREGMRAATGDPRVFLDADLTIPVEILDDFLHAIAEGADIAIASRYVPGAVVRRPWWRRSLGDAYRAFVRVLVPTGLEDTQCGGKAYTAEAARDLFARQLLNGYAFDAEVLFLARRSGYRVAEVPVKMHQSRETSIRLFRDAPRMLRDLVLIRANVMLRRYR
jgi:dolichyl-phosphate beta-glucosyltransferase